jgi:hypothetical protein
MRPIPQGIHRRVFAFKREGATVYYRCGTCKGISQKTYRTGPGRSGKPDPTVAAFYLRWHGNGCSAICRKCTRLAKQDDDLSKEPR